jgi:methyl-accepting chemotaxis protein
VSRATAEQTKAGQQLAKEGDEVRRIARQTARALAEQSEGVSALTSTFHKQTAALASIATTTAEQATTTQQIAQAVISMRGQTREALAGVSEQTKATAASAKEVGVVASRIAGIRQATLSQTGTVSDIASLLHELGAAGRPSLESA